jgi:hypothetical protein
MSEWFPIIRHMRMITKANTGLAVLSVRVVVDEFGRPVCWLTPTLDRIQPRATSVEALAALIETLVESKDRDD